VTDSAPRSVKRPVFGKPVSDEECTALREWAETSVVERDPPAEPAQLARHLDFMAAALPSKNLDETTGRMKVAVYASILGGYSNAALAHMARRACETLDWFPTPRQCLDLIGDYREPVTEQETARRLCCDYTNDKFERWIANMREGQPVGDVPERWLRIAVEQGVMRRLNDGSYVTRAAYHGPVKPYAPVLAA
jgi:hypothetical protein